MSMKLKIQDAMKEAMRAKDTARLECLRMAKGALLLKEKEGAQGLELSEEVSIQALRAEVKKRQQAVEQFVELGKTEEAEAYRKEISVLEEFLPRQLARGRAPRGPLGPRRGPSDQRSAASRV